MSNKLTREQWLEKKREYIGASDWAPVLGYDDYRTGLDVFASKVRGIQQDDNDVMAFGRYVEDFVGQLYSEKTGEVVQNLGATMLQIHPEYPFLAATLDRWLPEKKCPLELKTVQSKYIKIDDWWDGGPLKYRIQLQAQMACTGAERGVLAGLFFPGVRLAWVEIKRNDRFINSAIRKLRDFWHGHVLTGIPPEPTSHRDLPTVKKIYHDGDGSTIALDDSDLKMVETLDEIRDTRKEAKKEAEYLEAVLRGRIGNASFAALPDGTYVKALVQKDGKRVLRRWRP